MGVGDEIDDSLVELMLISPQYGEIRRQIQRNVGVVYPEWVGNELHDRSDNPVQIDVLAFGLALAGQGQEILHDARAALRRARDLLGSFGQRSLGNRMAQEGRVPDQDR